jgi:hypothetical protein
VLPTSDVGPTSSYLAALIPRRSSSWLALPLAGAARLAAVAAALGVLAVLLARGHGLGSSRHEAARLTLAGFWFCSSSGSSRGWLVAVVIPWVDAISVWRGPTDYVVRRGRDLFERISYAFSCPAMRTANIGPPDILFFALFLARPPFELRLGWTWASMTALLTAHRDV